MVRFDSEAVERAEHDADARTLFVWFRGNERPYAYHDVPEDVFHALCDAESQGRFMQQQVIGHYPYSPP